MNKVTLYTSCMMLLVALVDSDLRIVFLCDKDIQEACERATNTSTSSQAHGLANITLVPSSDNFMSNLRSLSKLVEEDPSIGVLVGFGGDHIVNAIATVGMETNMATITYTTSRHRKTLYSDYVISVSPDREGLARAIVTLISRKMIMLSVVICEDSLVGDGLLDVLKGYGVNISHTMAVSDNDDDATLRLKLLHIHDIGVRLMVVHVSHRMLARIASIGEALSYFDIGFAWIVTEEGLSSHPELHPGNFPPGILAVEGNEEDKYDDIMHAIVTAISEEIYNITTNAEKYGMTTAKIEGNLRTLLTHSSPAHADFIRGIKTNPHLFDHDGVRTGMQFRLLNYIRDNETQEPTWKNVGLIRGPDLELDGVVWPGPSIFGPIQHAREFYTIVTKPAEPFVYVRGPVTARDDCKVNNICLKIYSEDIMGTKAAIEHFLQEDIPVHDNYTLYCCEGIVVDILHSLSIELKFDFLLYFKENDDLGDYVNGTWTGLLGDVTSGAADVLAGAISITSERISAVTFTEAYYFSSFNMIGARERPYTTLWAFTRPFDKIVWILIIISATTVAIAAALYEWNSPFGLNPWGKKRKRNYTLGSALTMVYSLWFGHTVSTKSPKSWPSKVLQNFWAATAIFITAGYTANLAAFLAGNAYKDVTLSILDSRVTSQRVGVIQSSAVEEYTKALNTGLHTRFLRNYVSDVHEGIVKIRKGELNMYMDDTPLLEYALGTYDTNCTLKYAAHSFGENSYAFAMRKGSWLKKLFDPLILNYVELGVVDDLKWRYMGKSRQCQNKLLMTTNDLGFGVANTNGLFIMLLIGCGASVLFLIGEYAVYFLALPRLRNKPSNSIWRNRHLEFFSQRLYRSINSEKVEQPAQALVSKVRQKKFELQSHLTSARNRRNMNRQTRSVPAALRTYQLTRQAFSTLQNMTYPDLESYEDFSVHHSSDGTIYSISGNQIREEPSLQTNKVQFHHTMSSPLLTHTTDVRSACFVNPIFESDEEKSDDVSSTYASDQTVSSGRFQNLHKTDSVRVENGIIMTAVINETQTRQQTSPSSCGLCKNKGKLYETWPSPTTRKRSIKNRQNNKNKISQSTRESLADNNKRIVNTFSRKKCRTCSLSSLDNFRGNHSLEMKDNRMKSNLRNHAMGTMPRSPSISLDEGAVEALSKEDLLVLWKKSEIELQTKLNKMLHQNNHLRQLVDIAEQEAETRQQNSDVNSDGQITSSASSFKCSKL